MRCHLKATSALDDANLSDYPMTRERMISFLPEGVLENCDVPTLTEMFALIDRAWKDGYAAREIEHSAGVV